MKLFISTLFVFLGVLSLQAQSQKMKMTTDIPQGISMPNEVETRIGNLYFKDGFPSKETSELLKDYLVFNRAVDVFLDEMSASSMYAMRNGYKEMGIVKSNQMAIFETLMDSKALWLTANTETVYAANFLDLKTDNALVIEAPANVLGILDDMWMRYVADVGNAGPDKGKGGKYLILSPDYEGEIPAGYYTFKSRTYGVWFIVRGFMVNGDTKPAVDNIKKHLKIYPLAKADNPPAMEFKNVSGVAHNTIHPNNYEFYEELDKLIQSEHPDAINAEQKGRLALLGISKGHAFELDENKKQILNEAALTGAGIARTISFDSDDDMVYFYDDDKTWFSAFAIGNHEFMSKEGWLHLDARTMFMYNATGITPAMAIEMVGVGSQYAAAAKDADGKFLDGSKTYKLNIPANVPAKDFWSILLYDSQTRSMLQTDQRFPSISSMAERVQQNSDGSTDVYFGPKPPEGKEGNWVQTVPGKGFWLILRLYGPLEPWFDKTWRPGKIIPID
ncbi:DUF1254 domain-containing protein [uncultured Draconibacterium sp.]|uniref:DUF1254 domain-containing protein n=1 Tax=uncultured Draconibacterium sp. TaxID=1573823 RepID=UPI002AA88AF2|nr:DUF1254 domain-containing protein [uncultured Draconibacterium sp.]